MLQAHLDLITTADPLALRGCINYIENEVRPVVESQPGNLGLSLLASPEHGVAVYESLWASRNELGASEQVAASLRGEMARQARGSVTAAQYQIPVFEQEAPLRGGEGVRLTRIEVTRSAVTDVIEAFGDSAVPLLAGTPGFRSALLFADRSSGHLVSQTIWWDPRARAASPSVAAVIRADVLDAANCQIRAVVDYSLVFSSARKA
jgi:hypothetical protein